MKPVHPYAEKGYSLVEVLIVIVILAVVSTGLMVTFITGQREYSERDTTIRMQQQARLAMAEMERNIKMAGYGLMDMGNLKINIYKGGAISSWVMVEAGDGAGGSADTIAFRYQNPDIPTDMSTDIVTIPVDYPSSKPAVLPLSSTAGLQEKDLLIIYDPADPNKPASVLQISNIPSTGDKVDHISNPNKFPYNPPNSIELFPQNPPYASNGYGAGSRVIKLKDIDMRKVTYSLDGDKLIRDVWSSTTGVSLKHVVATGIEDLQVKYQFKDGTWLDTLDASHDITDLRGLRISVITRSANPDPRYQATQSFQLTGSLGNGKAYSGGGYRRMTMSTMVSLRNLAMRYTP